MQTPSTFTSPEDQLSLPVSEWAKAALGVREDAATASKLATASETGTLSSSLPVS